MKSPYVMAMVSKDVVENLPKIVPLHEVAVLMAVHGEEKVYIDEEADLPNGMDTEYEFEPDEEYARLERHYGGPVKNQSPSFAAIAYNGHEGFVRKCEEIEAATPRKRKRRVEAVKPLPEGITTQPDET